MIYTDLILFSIAVAVILVLVLLNIIRYYKYSLNLTFAALCLVCGGTILLRALNILNINPLPMSWHQNILLCLVLAACMLLLNIALIFPDRSYYRNILFLFLADLPGVASCVLLLATNLFHPVPPLSSEPGHIMELATWPPFLVSAIYITASLLAFIIRSQLEEYQYFRRDMILLFYGTLSFCLLAAACIFIIPSFVPREQLPRALSLLPLLLLLITVNYSVTSIEKLNLKKFYFSMLYWIILTCLLFFPSMIAYDLSGSYGSFPPILFAAALLIYFSLIYRFIRPPLEAFFQKEYRNLNDIVEVLLESPEYREDEKISWDENFRTWIDRLSEKFNITNLRLFLYHHGKKIFYASYSVGRSIQADSLQPDHSIIQALEFHSTVLDKALIASHISSFPGKDGIIKFLEDTGIDAALPFFDRQKNLVGFLLLGGIPRRKKNSRAFISMLESYRIQFQNHLASALFLEQTKETQDIEHDKMVVKSIKKRIIPDSLPQIGELRISSLYIDNSLYGGDYFDAIQVGDDRLVLFLADSSYTGVDSSLMTLELYTVFHTKVQSIDSPGKILETMNWVVSSSRFSRKHAPACCAVISSAGEMSLASAAYNPLVVFSPQTDEFYTYSLKGIPLGIDKSSTYEMKQVTFRKGMIGLFHSDGLVSCINESGEPYTMNRVQAIIRDQQDKTPALIVRAISSDLQNFMKGRKQFNDVTLVLFKY